MPQPSSSSKLEKEHGATALLIPRPSLPKTPRSTSTAVNSRSSSSFTSDKPGVLHPRVAVLLGVDKRWHLPLLFCRALSIAPAGWWGLRCGLTFLVALLSDEEEAAAAAVGLAWSVERRFRITEVFLAIIWVSGSRREWSPIRSWWQKG